MSIIKWIKEALFGEVKPWNWDYKYLQVEKRRE